MSQCDLSYIVQVCCLMSSKDSASWLTWSTAFITLPGTFGNSSKICGASCFICLKKFKGEYLPDEKFEVFGSELFFLSWNKIYWTKINDTSPVKAWKRLKQCFWKRVSKYTVSVICTQQTLELFVQHLHLDGSNSINFHYLL